MGKFNFDKDKPRTRNALIPRMEVSENNDELELSFSSEMPVEMWSGYKEILSHEPEAVNLERLDGMPWLWNHDWDKVIGKVNSVWLKNKRLHAKVKWATNAFAEEKKVDVLNGILTNASILYTIEEYVTNDEERTFIATKWTLYEISLVSVPADHTVGIGRSPNTLTPMIEISNEETRNQARQEELTRIQTIQGIAKQHGLPELRDELIENGATVEQAQDRYLEALAAQRQSGLARPVEAVGLSTIEKKQYSLHKALRAAVTGDWSEAGLEQEVSLYISEQTGRAPDRNGFFMPIQDLTINTPKARAPYAVGSDPTGGFLVQTDVLAESFIDALRNRAVIFAMGATMLSGLQGDVDIPGQDAVTQAFWVGEGLPVTESEATILQRQLRPKTVGTISQYSRLTILQPTIDIEQFIRNDFAREIALAIDLAGLAGTGTGGQPTGILNTPGIGSIDLGVNGGSLTWDDIVDLETEVTVDNADVNTCYYLTNARVKGELKKTEKFTGTNGNPIWGSSMTPNMMDMVNGYGAWCSNQIPSNLTKGTGTDLSAIIFGDFSQLICGNWGVFEILVNPFSVVVYAAGSVQIRGLQTVDFTVRYPSSFSAATDVVTA